MLIRVEDNDHQDTESAIKEAIELSKKLDHDVVFYDEDREWDIEVHQESTVESVYRYYGWGQ